jgi:hypothetical protein
VQRGWILVLAAALISCASGDSPEGGGGSASGAGDVGGSGGTGASTGGSGGAGGSGAAGGGGAAPESVPTGHDNVSAGELSVSNHYRLVWTMGQPSQNQQTATSTNYRLQGGLVGVNGSEP